MELKNAKVTVSFDSPNEIIEAMDSGDRLEFMQSLSCCDEVISYVMQQVFDECTDDGFHGSISCTWNGNAPMQQFRKLLIDVGADDVTKRRIDELERYAARNEETISRLHNEIRELKNKLRNIIPGGTYRDNY